MDTSVEFRRVAFRYGSRRRCIEGVNAKVTRGATLLLGVNGAGKSTVLRLAAGLLTPSSGSVKTVGHVGYLAQVVPRLPGLSVREQVSYAAWLSGVRRSDCDRMAIAALDTVGLSVLATRQTRSLSGGEAARLGLASTIVSRPDVLLLDEPSASLDPIARADVRLVLERLVQDGVCILASSHTAADLGEPYHSVLVLDDGQVVFDGSMASFLHDAHQQPSVAALARAVTVDRRNAK